MDRNIRAILTAWWKAWPSGPMPLALTRAISLPGGYPIAVKRLNLAIAQAKEMSLLGENILGTGFNFDWKSAWRERLLREKQRFLLPLKGTGEPACVRLILRFQVCGASPQLSIMWRPLPT